MFISKLQKSTFEMSTNHILLTLNEVCRACLLKTENMKALVDINNEEVLGLLRKLSSVSNLEIEINETLPAFLCDSCEEKLKLSYDFQLLCRRSNNFILECLNSNEPIELDASQVKSDSGSPNDSCNVKDDSDEEPLIKFNSVNNETNSLEEEAEDDPEQVEVEAEQPKEVDKRNKTKQTMRLPQFSVEDVALAIKKAREKFFRHTECIKCGFKSINSRALSVHMSRLHKELKETWCSACNVEYEDLQKHRQIHAENDFKCQFCGKVLINTSHFLEHLACHSNERSYKCSVCKKGFISKRHLISHYRTHTNDRPHKCPFCKKGFIQIKALKVHIKLHKKFNCKICDNIFYTQDMYDSHKCFSNNDEDVEISIKDDKDNKTETESDLAENEELVHPQNFCKICNQRVRSLKAHDRRVHSSNQDTVERRVLCTYCGKQFKTKSKLNVHMRIHTGETPYKCSFCCKRMATRNQLVVHERVHTGEKPHICAYCGKGFAQSSVLNTHMRQHTGRPEECNMCFKRFCRPAELRLHMRQHTGEKPFLCTECGHSFKQRSHLVEHIKTHSNERPYQCQYCEKGFKQNSSLKAHVQIHLGQKPFKCSQCPYACRQSYSLQQHMLQHDKDLPDPERPHICCLCQRSFTTQAMLNSHYCTVHNVNNSETLNK